MNHKSQVHHHHGVIKQDAIWKPFQVVPLIWCQVDCREIQPRTLLQSWNDPRWPGTLHNQFMCYVKGAITALTDFCRDDFYFTYPLRAFLKYSGWQFLKERILWLGRSCLCILLPTRCNGCMTAAWCNHRNGVRVQSAHFFLLAALS